jgi:hypothetical protein
MPGVLVAAPGERVAFFPDEPFIKQNHDAVVGLFTELAADFPDHSVLVEGEPQTTAQALQLDDNDELTLAARRWLWEKAQGAQHGYDRGVGSKVNIPPEAHDKYMTHLGGLAYGTYNLVEGGSTTKEVDGSNLLVPLGFPHLNGGRLHTALKGNYSDLWLANSTAMLSGQRRRWTDNPNEATTTTVVHRTATASGLNTANTPDYNLVQWWLKNSPFAQSQARLGEGPVWRNAYATEAEMGRAALELALVRAGDYLFDFDDYTVTEHTDTASNELEYPGGIVPARTVRAWEYHLANGKSAWVTNAAAVRRIAPDGTVTEPRPDGTATVRDAYDLLQLEWHSHESIIATGAPHLRLCLDMATTLLTLSAGHVNRLHLAAAPWEDHEPPVTGVAQIVSTDKADKRLRAAVQGKDPDAPELKSL